MTEEMKGIERWITMKDVCEYLSVSRHTLLRWMSSLGMPAHKIGGTWRFRTSEIDEWVQNTTRTNEFNE